MTLYITPLFSFSFHADPAVRLMFHRVRGLGRGQDYIIVLGRVWVRVTPCKLVCRIPESAWRGGRADARFWRHRTRALAVRCCLSRTHSHASLAPLDSTLLCVCIVVLWALLHPDSYGGTGYSRYFVNHEAFLATAAISSLWSLYNK